MATGTKAGQQDTQVRQGRWDPLLVRHRNQISVAVHAVLFALSLFAAFGLAYNFHGISIWFDSLYLPLLLLVLPIKLLVFRLFRLFRGSWRYVGLKDLISIAVGSYVSSFLFLATYYLLENMCRRLTGKWLLSQTLHFATAVFLLDWVATFGFVAAARVLVRLHYESTRGALDATRKRVLIVGTGDHAANVLREIQRNPGSGYEVVGLVDRATHKLGHRIHGVEVIGAADDIQDLCDKHLVDELLIAMPEAKAKELRRIIALCEGNSLRFRIVPAVTDLITGRVHVSQIRPVDIEDLLGRDQVTLDLEAIGRELSGQRIVVTGAGGSIGSEMCRQIVRFQPERLVLIEQAENNLFEIHRELQRAYPDLDLHPEIGDICDAVRVRNLFSRHQPNVVFHAAAHKHVPMMEWNCGEAIKNNIVGTRTVATAAADHGVKKMVMISTDKAVNPTSVMGCTKRVAELFVQHFSARRDTQYVTVRFGNVLGSSGSVIPIFRQQIATGGPVTVTHPEMTRYFMTIPEASQLVLQAGAMGNGGEIYVLDMGEPVKIVDLAHNMVTLSGLRPGEDIDIVFTGTRPGEKLFEELSITGENISGTSHPKIGIWNYRPEDWNALIKRIDHLISIADSAIDSEIRDHLKVIVPEYEPASEAPATAPAQRTSGEVTQSAG